jgi:membrane protease YdiL (CAAX protease family)
MTNAGPLGPVSGSGTGQGATHGPSPVRTVFLGPNGIRAGWRILIFIAVFMLLRTVIRVIAAQIPGIRELMRAQTMTPALQLLGFITPLIALTAAGVMTRIEHRTFADYGLPASQAFGRRFWQGIAIGFVMLCLLLGVIAAFGGFSVSGLAVTGIAAVTDGALYALGFLFVGVFEEFTFRGYLQSTLTSGIGFWPAAVALSVLFGAAHLGNPGEAQIGAVMAGSFGLVSAFALRRTGSLWFSIGMHASWDWGETYFFGTADSGILAQGHLLNSSFHGPAWLTGGSIGPEGSYLVFGVLITWAVIIHLWFPPASAAPTVSPSSSTSILPSSRQPARAP